MCLCVSALIRDTYVHACVPLKSLKRKTNVLGLCDGPMYWLRLAIQYVPMHNAIQNTRIYHICIHNTAINPCFFRWFFFSLSLWPSVALLFGPMHRHVNWTMIFIFERKEKSFSSIFTEHSTPFVQLQCSPKSKDFLFNSISCVCAPLATRSQPASDRSVSLLLWHSHLLSRRASTFSSAFNYFFYEISMNCIILHM